MENQMWQNQPHHFNLTFFSPPPGANLIPKEEEKSYTFLLNFLFFLVGEFFCRLFCWLFCTHFSAVSGADQISAHPAAQKPEREIIWSRSEVISPVLAAVEIALLFPTIKTCWLFIRISRYREETNCGLANTFVQCAAEEILFKWNARECWRLNCYKRMAITGKVGGEKK